MLGNVQCWDLGPPSLRSGCGGGTIYNLNIVLLFYQTGISSYPQVSSKTTSLPPPSLFQEFKGCRFHSWWTFIPLMMHWSLSRLLVDLVSAPIEKNLDCLVMAKWDFCCYGIELVPHLNKFFGGGTRTRKPLSEIDQSSRYIVILSDICGKYLPLYQLSCRLL